MAEDAGAGSSSKPMPNTTYDGHAQADQEETDATIERRIVRKQDMHLMPLLFAIYLLSFLDRSNIGSACYLKFHSRQCANIQTVMQKSLVCKRTSTSMEIAINGC
jgi:hypothetical protein